MARGGYVADVKYIASIYPGKLPTLYRNYGSSIEATGKNAVRRTAWELEPVRKGGKPFVLQIPDCFESVIDFMGQRGARLPKPVACESIVQDLLQHWTGGMYHVPDGARPGIMEIINSTPSDEEKLQMRTMQTRYFEYWFLQGEGIYARNQDTVALHGGLITPLMLLAADWIGEKRAWSNPEIIRDVIACPFCQTQISAMAIVCPNCSTQVREVPPDLEKFFRKGGGEAAA